MSGQRPGNPLQLPLLPCVSSRRSFSSSSSFARVAPVQNSAPVSTITADAGSAPYESGHRFQRPEGEDPFSQPPATRPGLGTAYGETRASRVSETTFQRANGNVPAAVAALYYNDEEGARALTNGGAMDGPADGARAYVGGGVVTLNVRAPFRGDFPWFRRGGAPT